MRVLVAHRENGGFAQALSPDDSQAWALVGSLAAVCDYPLCWHVVDAPHTSEAMDSVRSCVPVRPDQIEDVEETHG